MQVKYNKNTRNYELTGKLIEEIKLRKYSYRTGKSYISLWKDFWNQGKIQENFYFPTPIKADQLMVVEPSSKKCLLPL